MKKKLLDSSLIGADETTIQMVKNFKKGEGKSKKCYLWVYHGDDKAPYTVFDFKESRSHSVPLKTLGEYTGYLQTDGYGGYETMVKKSGDESSITHCCCWAHVRRKFVETEKAGDSRATEALDIIGRLYGVERQLKELKTEEERLSLRQEKSKPILDEFRQWMDDRLDVLPGSLLGKAIGYANNRWDKLTIYTDTANVPIDNNAVERAIRPVAVGRKNWLFAGSEMGGEAAATFFTLIESAKRCEVDPWIYIQTLLKKIIWHKRPDLEDLFPNNIELPADAYLTSDTPAQPQA
jgi:transposase